jgi:hypothetical protein
VIPFRAATFVIMTTAAVTGCTINTDGDGPRYTGRVLSVSASKICVGPSTSSSSTTCGTMPQGLAPLPKVGQCVSLFARFRDQGTSIAWTAASLRLKIADSDCHPRT